MIFEGYPYREDNVPNEGVNTYDIDFHTLLNTLLSNTKNKEEKKRILKEKYGLKMEEKLEEEVGLMCNLSEYVWEQGLERGVKQGEELFALLTAQLLKFGKTEELLRAVADKEYREQLYRAYGITKG